MSELEVGSKQIRKDSNLRRETRVYERVPVRVFTSLFMMLHCRRLRDLFDPKKCDRVHAVYFCIM